MKLAADLNGLRHEAESRVVRGALRASHGAEGCRLVQYSIQWDHLHLVVEARDEVALGAAMKGLGVRLARRLNRLWGRKGRVFADRYPAHVLRLPAEVREALRYVLCNGRKHGAHHGSGPDPLSSGAAFRSWLDCGHLPALADACVLEARHWLLTTGWSKHCPRFATTDVPDSRSRSRRSLRKLERRRRRAAA